MIPSEVSKEPGLQPDRWSLLSKSLHERALSELFKALRATKIEPIAIKGWSLGRYYPENEIRSYSDVDVAVSPDQFELAKDTIAGLKSLAVGVDLHEGLRDRDALSWEELLAESYTIELNGVPVRVLGEEDNLRVTAAHWLIDGGVYRSRLWDIYYLVRHRKKGFDWPRCLDVAGPIRRTWVLAAIATARDYLDLDVADLPAVVREFELPSWYRRTLEREWDRGPYLRIPLSQCIRRPKVLIEQTRRRFPPNRIAATTDTEGPIDDSPRLKYQVKSIFKKIPPAGAGIYRQFLRRP